MPKILTKLVITVLYKAIRLVFWNGSLGKVRSKILYTLCSLRDSLLRKSGLYIQNGRIVTGRAPTGLYK